MDVKAVPVMPSVASILVVMHTLDNVIANPELVVSRVIHALKAFMVYLHMDANVNIQHLFKFLIELNGLFFFSLHSKDIIHSEIVD